MVISLEKTLSKSSYN